MSEMPKILRIATIPLSLNILLTGQMKFMKANGYEVLMISADGKEIEALTTREKCPHIIVNMSRSISPFQDLKCLYQLVKIIRRERPDIVHTHTPKAGLLGMLAAKICAVPLKIHTIAGLPLMTASGMKRQLLVQVEKLTYWAADFVLPNSHSIMNFVRQKKLTSNAKLDMIGGGSSNGIDLGRFSINSLKADRLQRVKDSVDYLEEHRYILAVGRVVKDKGIEELVRAYIRLKEDYNGLRLVILGPLENERAEELLDEDVLNQIQIDEDITHINWSDEVEYYMDLAEILVHASYREGFPNVMLQAGAMECPIVCSEIAGNIDIVQDHTTGLYFEVGNVDDLVEKISFALQNQQKMEAFAKKLRLEIEEQFSRVQFHKALLQFYQTKFNGK